ncbi:MAG: hypothetical protein WAQ98_19720, partial [Blastocatellia bacterium]
GKHRLFYMLRYLNCKIFRFLVKTITVTEGHHRKFGFKGDNKTAKKASFQFPKSLTIDRESLFIADTDNNRIRAINLSTGVITTVAGDGVNAYAGDEIMEQQQKLVYQYQLILLLIRQETYLFLTKKIMLLG